MSPRRTVRMSTGPPSPSSHDADLDDHSTPGAPVDVPAGVVTDVYTNMNGAQSSLLLPLAKKVLKMKALAPTWLARWESE